MKVFFTLCLVLVGLVNLAPVVGVFSAQQMAEAYGVTINGSEMVVLMKHRALLFGLLGGFTLFAVFVRSLQLPALVMCGLSMSGFVWLMHFDSVTSHAMQRILWFDYAGLVFWLLAALAYTLNRNRGSDRHGL